MPAFVIGAAVSAAADDVHHDHDHNYFPGNAKDCEDPAVIAAAATLGVTELGETLADIEGSESGENDILTWTTHGSEQQFLDVELKDDSYVITAIGVKGGPNFALYVEEPWTSLHAPHKGWEPVDGRTGDKYPQISHWFACGTPTTPPTEEPTVPPTDKPTEPPTEEPTVPPTDKPTEPPTEEPTVPPTDEPTDEPTEPSTDEPTPTDTPSPSGTPSPSDTPSPSPSETEEPGLPDTGSSPAVLIAAALTLLAVGAVALRNRLVKA